MTQPEQPQSHPETPPSPERDEARAPESEADQRRGVLQQRQHIKDLTGEDPLRGGIAD